MWMVMWGRWANPYHPPHTVFPYDLHDLFLAGLLMAAIHECGHALVASALGMRLTIFFCRPVVGDGTGGKWRFKNSLLSRD